MMDPFMQRLFERPIGGRYVLVESLGKGGYGHVYVGEHGTMLTMQRRSPPLTVQSQRCVEQP